MTSETGAGFSQSNGHASASEHVENSPGETGEFRAARGHPFGRVLRVRGVAPLVVFWLLAFMPVGMTPLATVLTLREYHYPYLAAGTVLGAYSVGMAVSAPFAGRLMGRIGISKVLIPCAVAYACGTGSLIMLAGLRAPLTALSACAIITGTTFPRVTAALRGLWPSLISLTELREQAYMLDATLAEVGPIVGALLVVLLASVALPLAALLASAGFAVVGTVGFATSRATRHRSRSVLQGNANAWSPFRLPGIWVLLWASAALGGISGAIDVAAPAFAEFHGARSAAGFALSACALGSMAGGIVSPRFSNTPVLTRYRRALTIQFLAFCLPLLADSNITIVLLLFVAGAPFSLAYGTAGSLASAISPPGARTQTFATMSSAMALGASLAAASAGFMDHLGGPVAALGTATCFAAIAFITAIPGLQRRCGLSIP
jgi:MFS family permease